MARYTLLDDITGHRTFILTLIIVIPVMGVGLYKLDGPELVEFVRELGMLALGLAGLWAANEFGGAAKIKASETHGQVTEDPSGRDPHSGDSLA